MEELEIRAKEIFRKHTKWEMAKKLALIEWTAGVER
jgi:hypothetical protein